MKFWIFALVLVGMASPALGQTSKAKELIFEPDQILGDSLVPNLGKVEALPAGELESLVKARASFEMRLIESVEELGL